jgi:uncharacterized membrane protein YeaQ/YmgE (transglycosylase-associated protein family)
MHVVGAIIIGFIVGLLARFLTPGPSNPSGFILTTVLGIVGALVATYLGQAIHLYEPDENAGFIAAVVGAVIVLLVWRLFTRSAA